jgi:hypothetical protein
MTMATAAQITANCTNATQSTGPRTIEGKLKSARNSAKHGLSSREFIVDADSQQEFTGFMESLHAELQPIGALELDLFRNLAHAAWTLRRCRIADAKIDAMFNRTGGCALLDINAADHLKLLDLYTRRAERSYFRVLQELRRVQTERHFRLNVDEILEVPPTPKEEAPSPLAESHATTGTCVTFAREFHRARNQAQFDAVRDFIDGPLPRATAVLPAPAKEQTNPIPLNHHTAAG